MLAIDEIRSLFPYLLRCTYLNTATAGLSWRGQGEAVAEFYDHDKARGICGSEQWRAKADATRTEIASLLGVSGACVHFVGSTTEALNILALSIPFQSGDRVVLADDEFASVSLPWMRLRAAGVEVIRVPIASEGARTETLARAIGPRTRVLAVSHVHWRTGTQVDLAKLSVACREHGSRLIVDGAHAVGAIPVDGKFADAYCSSVFKWLLSGFGLGFVALSEGLSDELTPVLRGYNNESPSRSVTYGHANYPGIYALHATLALLKSIGWTDIHARVQGLSTRLASALRLKGLDVVTPEGAHAGIVSFRHPHSATLVRSLAEQAIFVENGGSLVRISPHFYNTDEEIERFVAALGSLC